MSRKKRPWDDLAEEDPAAGLLNLFDVWIAFAAASLLAMIGFYQQALANSNTVHLTISMCPESSMRRVPWRLRGRRF